MNKADSERMAGALESLGLRAAPAIEQADVIVVNTCSVRRSAEVKALSKLGALKPIKKSRPDTIIGLAGCMVGEDLSELRKVLPFVDVFLRPLEVEGLLKIIVERKQQTPSIGGNGSLPPDTAFEDVEAIEECRLPQDTVAEMVHTPSIAIESFDSEDVRARGTFGPTRWVPIIYGCDNFCTYCIVPLRRGRERSRPVEEILVEVERMVAEGAREVTLLGQNVDSFGHDLPGRPDLAYLLTVLNDVDGLHRLRFLTSHPKDMSERLITAVARLPKVCEHINLPVQSGDDGILKRMGRGYAVEEYRRLVGLIRARIPAVSLSTDLIVGFPGETREQFESSYQLLADIRFEAVHVAMYSPRPETAAARLRDDVPPSEKKARLQMVEELQERIATETNAALQGTIVEVLVEGRNKGKWQGRTRTNKLVFFKSDENWLGKLAMVMIDSSGPWSLQGGVTVEKVPAV